MRTSTATRPQPTPIRTVFDVRISVAVTRRPADGEFARRYRAAQLTAEVTERLRSL